MAFLKSTEIIHTPLTNNIKLVASRLRDGKIYGTNGVNLYEQVTNGWSFICPLKTPLLLVKAGDGEVLVSCDGNGLYKSSGWGTPALSWNLKLFHEGSNFLSWGLDSEGHLALATHYRATDYTKSRYTWLSCDCGDSWKVVHDLGENTNIHMHLAHIDQFNGNRLWISYHDDQPVDKLRAIKYSDDLGDTWHLLSDEWNPTTAVATPNGMVFGTDHGPGGVLHVRNKANPQDMTVNLSCPFPVEKSGFAWCFSVYADYDSISGAAVLSFISQVNNTPAAMFSSDGITCRELLRTSPQPNASGFREFCFHEGQVLINSEIDSVKTIMSIESPIYGEDSIYTHDTGRILGGIVQGGNKFTNTSVGVDSVAGPSKDCISIGMESRAGSNNDGSPGCISVGVRANSENTGSVAIGVDSQAKVGSVAIGRQVSTRTVDVCIGALASCDGSGVSIGYNAKSLSSGVAIGRNTYSGVNSIAIGRDSIAAKINSVSFGGTATENHQFLIGVDRYILLDNVSINPPAPEAGKTALYMKEGNLCIKGSDGVEKRIATE